MASGLILASRSAGGYSDDDFWACEIGIVKRKARAHRRFADKDSSVYKSWNNKTFYSDRCLCGNVSRIFTNGVDQAGDCKLLGLHVGRETIFSQRGRGDRTDGGKLNVFQSVAASLTD